MGQVHHQGNLRSGRIFFLAAFIFCGAAIVTGFCFVYAVQLGLEQLALYHPSVEKQAMLGSLHPVITPPQSPYPHVLMVSACMPETCHQKCKQNLMCSAADTGELDKA